MAEQEVDHYGNLELLAKAQTVDNLYRTYRRNLGKEEGELAKYAKELERLVSDGDEITADSFMRASPQAMDATIQGYRESTKKARERAIKGSGNTITDEYASGVDAILAEAAEKAAEKVSSENPEFKELSEEDQSKVIEPYLYAQIAQVLSNLDPDVEELEDDLKALVELNEATDEDKKVAATRKYLQARGIGYMEHVVDPQEAARSAVSRLTRVIAKEMLAKDDKGNYTINRKAFKKFYGTEENYKKIALQLEMAKAQQYAETA